jgi:hypothetical protein
MCILAHRSTPILIIDPGSRAVRDMPARQREE